MNLRKSVGEAQIGLGDRLGKGGGRGYEGSFQPVTNGSQNLSSGPVWEGVGLGVHLWTY